MYINKYTLYILFNPQIKYEMHWWRFTCWSYLFIYFSLMNLFRSKINITDIKGQIHDFRTVKLFSNHNSINFWYFWWHFLVVNALKNYRQCYSFKIFTGNVTQSKGKYMTFELLRLFSNHTTLIFGISAGIF